MLMYIKIEDAHFVLKTKQKHMHMVCLTVSLAGDSGLQMGSGKCIL